MKKNTKALALLLSVAMLLGLLAGCGSNSSTTTAAASEAEESTAAVEQAEAVSTEEAPAADTDAEEASVPEAEASVEEEVSGTLTEAGIYTYHYTEIALPLTEEDVTLSLWTDFLPPLFAAMEGMEDNSVYIELEKRTGIKLDITSVATTEASTNASLVIASGDFPDFWYSFVNYYSGTIDSAVEDEIILNLADYKEDMPNYFSLIDENEELRKETYTDSGIMAQTYGVFADPRSTQGLGIRQDWLDELGLDTPVTYDDYYDVLTAFKNNYGASYWMNSDGEQYFIAGYNISSTYFVKDGEVIFGAVTDEYKDYLTMMNKWYSEGLIWQDFATYSDSIDEAAIGKGDYGLFDLSLSKYDNIISNATDENIAISAVTPAVNEAGEILHVGQKSSDIGNKGLSLTTHCPSEYIDIACQWLDYWYTPDGSMLANYGVEGEAYNLVDGEIVYTDIMLNNPDLNFTWAMNKYAMGSGSFIMDGDRIYSDYSDTQWEMMDVYNSDYTDFAYSMPTVSLTTEESEVYTPLYNDIDTYISETFLLFINGSKPLDEFDEFVEKIYSLGLDQCLEYEQAAYDRYLER
jgi:putative aldouronate transport system substrate-binding protein